MENDIITALLRVDHVLANVSKRMVKSSGLSMQQHAVLRLIGQQTSCNAGDLAQALRVHPSTLTPTLKTLEQRGYISRVPDPEDSRRARLSIAEPGRALDAPFEGSAEQAVASAIGAASFSKQDVAQFVEQLTRLADTLIEQDKQTAQEAGFGVRESEVAAERH